MSWPLTGGATAPAWSDQVRLHVWLALGRGNTFHLGPHPFSHLDAGNVLGRYAEGGPGTDEVFAGLPFVLDHPVQGRLDAGNYLAWPLVPGVTRGPVERLWVDVSCDVIDVTIHTGATSADGVLATAEAGTCTLTLADPDRIFDPANLRSLWSYQGRSRLQPGLPVIVWAEALQAGIFITRHTLFVGTVDSFKEPWSPHPSERKCTVQASDATADLANRKRPEVAPVGAGDLVHERLQRLLDAFDGPPLLAETSAVPLQATTMAGTAWQLLNAAAGDEIGFLWVAPYGHDPLDYLFHVEHQAVRFVNRDAWFRDGPAALTIQCPMLIAATVSALDRSIKNSITAGRSGGTSVTVRSQDSINLYGEHTYSRTDLGVEGDDDAGRWANYLLMIAAYPRVTLQDVTMRPALSPALWWQVLSIDLVRDRVAVLWTPPGAPPAETYNVTARVVGITHTINFDRWEVRFALGAAESGSDHDFTLDGPVLGRLDHGNILSFPHEGTISVF